MSGGEWDRDLDIDVDEILAWGCTALLSLIEDHEIEELQITAHWHTHSICVLNLSIARWTTWT